MTVFGRLAGLAMIGALACLPSAGRAQSPPAATATAAPPSAPTSAPVAAPPKPLRHLVAAPAPATPAVPARPGARLAPGQPAPPAELEAFVDGVVRQAMARDHIAGVTVSVVQGGQVVLKKGYGAASLAPYRPVDPDLTLFRIGSISKTFTWMLVLKQVEAGHMRLDADINRYLPDSLQIHDEGFSRPILLRNLMNHTPGFEDRVLGQLFERNYDRVRPLRIYLREERPRRVREPGTLVSYSNYGAALAGVAVTEASGKPFEALVESDITGPLGMSHTTFREPHPAKIGLPAPMSADLARDVSAGFHWAATGFQARPYEFIEQVAPAGAASTTAADMSRYMLMMLGGGQLGGVVIYGPATAAAFASPLPAPAPGVPAWRHGLLESPLAGGFTGAGHEGGTLSFLSNMVLVPDLDLGVFISTNTDTGGALASSLPDRIVQRFYAGPPGGPRPGSPQLADDRGAFEGVYLVDRRAYHGLEGFIFRLIGAETVHVTSDGKLVIEGMDGISRWAPDGAPAAGQFVSDEGPARLVFQMADGKARRFFSPDGIAAFERVGLVGQVGTLIFLTALTAIAAIATLIGLLMRARRDFRETPSQRRASLLQTSQAGLWLAAMLLLGIWSTGAGDLAKVMYNWPGFTLVLASACAFLASLLAVATLVFVPLVWRGGRRVDSWTGGRKARFTVSALIFLGYAALLLSWGALEPWSA